MICSLNYSYVEARFWADCQHVFSWRKNSIRLWKLLLCFKACSKRSHGLTETWGKKTLEEQLCSFTMCLLILTCSAFAKQHSRLKCSSRTSEDYGLSQLTHTLRRDIWQRGRGHWQRDACSEVVCEDILTVVVTVCMRSAAFVRSTQFPPNVLNMLICFVVWYEMILVWPILSQCKYMSTCVQLWFLSVQQ